MAEKIKGYLGYVKTKAGKKYYSPDTGGRYFKTPQAAVKFVTGKVQKNIRAASMEERKAVAKKYGKKIITGYREEW